MAITATLTAASAYCLKYFIQYDGVGGAGSGTIHIPRATLIADSESSQSASPLGEVLEATTNLTAWGNLAKGAQISLYACQGRVVGASSFGARFDGTFGPVVLNLSAYCLDGVVTEGIVEIRFNHTIDR